MHGQLLHAGAVGSALCIEQAGLLVLGHVAGQPEVHALSRLQGGLRAVVLQQQDHAGAQQQQQGGGEQGGAHVQAPPDRQGAALCRVHGWVSNR